jgi:glycosyltransferase involved in cell wall biosynthesis
MDKINLTAIITTFNEEKNIEEAIRSVRFADEIIVVDSFSTDQTPEIIKEYKNVKLFRREFKNFSDQRKFAISKAKYNWILFPDADERISKESVRRASPASNAVASSKAT